MTNYVSELALRYDADPGLMTRIIGQMKSKGSFDQLRKEILADIDTKPAYQNLRQRVENSVNRYLRSQKWSPDLVKNKLRDSLKRHLTDGNYIHVGPVLNQVLTPDLCSQVAPEVDKEVCKELGVPEDEEMPPEEQSPNQRRRDDGWDGEGGSGHNFGGPDQRFGGSRSNGRAWRHDTTDFFYPYGGGGGGYHRYRGGHLDGELSPTTSARPVNYDEMDLEYSKDEAVQLNLQDNPAERQKWALQQLAAQKIKIEEELKRIEIAEQHHQQVLQEEENQRALAEQQALAQQQADLDATANTPPPREEVEDEIEEPKTPEMSDGEDSDVPEMQIDEDSRTASKDSCDASQTPTEETKTPVLVVEPHFEKPEPVVKSEPDTPPVKEEPELKEPEVPKPTEVEPEVVVKEEPKPSEPKNKEETSKRRMDERSRSKDERSKSDHRKEHSSSSSSSKRHSSSSSKSSAHKTSSSSSRHDSSSSKSGSSSSKSKDDKSSSHRSSSSRRDSDRYKSSSSSSSCSHRKDDKYRRSSSSSSSQRRGEDSNNLYYFTSEQTVGLVKERALLDQVMLRLELESEGYESLLSESEEEDTEMSPFEVELELREAVIVETILDIKIPGAEEEADSGDTYVPLLNEINANEIIGSSLMEKLRIKKAVNGGWNHVEKAEGEEQKMVSEAMSGKRRLSVVMDKCPSDLPHAETSSPKVPSAEIAAPPKRKRIVRKIDQRYSTDDLYKPRPTFTSSRRSRE